MKYLYLRGEFSHPAIKFYLPFFKVGHKSFPRYFFHIFPYVNRNIWVYICGSLYKATKLEILRHVPSLGPSAVAESVRWPWGAAGEAGWGRQGQGREGERLSHWRHSLGGEGVWGGGETIPPILLVVQSTSLPPSLARSLVHFLSLFLFLEHASLCSSLCEASSVGALFLL